MENLEASLLTVGYRISSCITKGSLSEVYQATHVESGTVVAIKRHKHFDMHPAQQKECETEVSLLQSLDHAHLIKYHTHFIHDNDLYVVMEHAAGGTLAQQVEASRKSGKPLEETHLWRWLYDVASSLAYLHCRRVLHRDVKPSHIFLGEDGQAKLGDFGLSKAMSTRTQCAFSCVGTPFYMSPEIVKGDGYSFGSDVWSLGCSMYELAMGYPPFFRKDMDFYALGDAICHARYPALSLEAWSREFVDLISEILAVDPEKRPNAQRILDLAGCRVCRMETAARIQDFQILGTIGRGKFSEVHRSLWKGREVALKRVQIFDMDSDARQECKSEVNLLKSLDHDTIIRYLDSFIEGSELIIVLELASHGDVSNLCRQLKLDARILDEAQTWAVFLQVVDALDYMHEHRVMHRDIKPANIFVCADGVVKLGDLGLGRYFSSNTYRAHSVVGTPYYMSPEVITNSDGYFFKSDIWSLGCVLYELSCLSSPFASSGLNYYALGNRIRKAEYPSLPEGTSPRVRALCSEMIEVQRDLRPDASSVHEATRRHFQQAISDHSLPELSLAAQIVRVVLSPGVAAAARSSLESEAVAISPRDQAAASTAVSGASAVGSMMYHSAVHRNTTNATDNHTTPSTAPAVLNTVSEGGGHRGQIAAAMAAATISTAASSVAGTSAPQSVAADGRSGYYSAVMRRGVGASSAAPVGGGGGGASGSSGALGGEGASKQVLARSWSGEGGVTGGNASPKAPPPLAPPPHPHGAKRSVAPNGGAAMLAVPSLSQSVQTARGAPRPLPPEAAARRNMAGPSGSLSARGASRERTHVHHRPGLQLAGRAAMTTSSTANQEAWRPPVTSSGPSASVGAAMGASQAMMLGALPPIQRPRDPVYDAFAGDHRHGSAPLMPAVDSLRRGRETSGGGGGLCSIGGSAVTVGGYRDGVVGGSAAGGLASLRLPGTGAAAH